MALRRVFAVGGSITPFTGKGAPLYEAAKKEGKIPTLADYITNSIRGASENTGIPLKEVERAWIGNFTGELFANQGHLGAAVAGAAPELRFVPSMRVEGACASGGLALASAIDAIHAGVDTALVVGAEVQNTVSAREGARFLARAADYDRQSPLDDFTFPALFARRIKAYCEAHGVGPEEFAHVSVKAYANAAKNPLAHMQFRGGMELADAQRDGKHNPKFLGNAELKDWLKVSDCSQVSDGGAAMFLVSEAGLAKYGIKPEQAMELVSVGVATDSLYEDPADATVMETATVAAQRLFAGANGITAKDVGVGEVHDCFTVAEVLMTEALGFAGKGEGTQLAKEGGTSLTGSIPINTGGGLIGFGHPVGATGVKQVLEVYRQMKSQCGEYQLEKTPEIGITANMGGDDKTVVTSLWKNL